MAPQTEAVGDDATGPDDPSLPEISAQETVPGRTVFTEADNTDGWIATDLTVAVADHR